MDNILKKTIELCLAVYRITDKFPEKEVLKPKIRGLSIDIIESLMYNGGIPTNASGFFNSENLRKKLRVMFVYFSLAEKQGWLDGENFTILRGEYTKLYKSIENQQNFAKDASPKLGLARIRGKNSQILKSATPLSRRQEKIMQFIKGRADGAVISEIADLIGVSNKTIERELKKLISGKLVHKSGQTKSARFIIDN